MLDSAIDIVFGGGGVFSQDLTRSVDDYLVMLRSRVTKELLDILFRVETETSDANR